MKSIDLEKKQKRNFNLKSSLVLRDAFNYYKSYRPQKTKFIISETQFGSIIKAVSLKLIEKFLEGHPIKFPHHMGSIQLQKREVTSIIKNGKFISSAVINWPETLKLWDTYKEAKEEKKVVRYTNQFVFKIVYLKRAAKFVNKTIVGFRPQRSFKKAVSLPIKEGKLDGFLNKTLIYGSKVH